jgi:hypothetical protein
MAEARSYVAAEALATLWFLKLYTATDLGKFATSFRAMFS